MPIDVTSRVSAEQRARDMLEETGVSGAQNFSAGELVFIANTIRKADRADDAEARIKDLEDLLRDIKKQSQRTLDPKNNTAGPGPYGTLESIISEIDNALGE